MGSVWEKMKQTKEQARDMIQALISDNVEAINDAVVEFIDSDDEIGAELIKNLIVLRNRRNNLFDVRDALDEEIEYLAELIKEV